LDDKFSVENSSKPSRKSVVTKELAFIKASKAMKKSLKRK